MNSELLEQELTDDTYRRMQQMLHVAFHLEDAFEKAALAFQHDPKHNSDFFRLNRALVSAALQDANVNVDLISESRWTLIAYVTENKDLWDDYFTCNVFHLAHDLFHAIYDPDVRL